MINIFYNGAIDETSVAKILNKKINQIYKLLPLKEEGGDWERLLDNLIEEFAGMTKVLLSNHDILFSLLSKMAGLKFLTQESDFHIYRRTIFECISLCNELMKNVSIRES